MTGLTKPRKPRAIKPAIVPLPTLRELSPLEARVVADIRRMNADCVSGIAAMADAFAREFPRCARPALRLVGSGK